MVLKNKVAQWNRKVVTVPIDAQTLFHTDTRQPSGQIERHRHRETQTQTCMTDTDTEKSLLTYQSRMPHICVSQIDRHRYIQKLRGGKQRQWHIGSGNGLLPDGTKPLPEPMFTLHEWDSVAFNWEQLHGECPSYYFVRMSLKII